MRLAVILLKNVQNSNAFQETNEYTLQTGNADTLYFRIVNLDQKDPVSGNYLRWVPDVAATAIAKFGSIDQSKVIARASTNPFAADDRSIWQVPIMTTDFISDNAFQFQLTNLGVISTLPLVGTLTSTPLGPTGQGRYYA